MLRHALPQVWQAERAASGAGIVPALHQLRRLSLADFGDVMLAMPNPEFPALSALLARMPEEAVQRRFNGSAGRPLMHESVSFVRAVSASFRELTGRSLRGGHILDFGCGWGRLLRMMPYFSDPECLEGVDPMPAAIELCREHGVPGHLAVSHALPGSLPVRCQRFDLIYSYSVFTHLSRRAMDTALAALRHVVAEDGLLALTVRPIRTWDALERHEGAGGGASMLRDAHLQEGFAFRPHNVAPVDGDVTYGDSSVDIPWFAARYAQWELRGLERGWDDQQTVLLLTPR